MTGAFLKRSAYVQSNNAIGGKHMNMFRRMRIGLWACVLLVPVLAAADPSEGLWVGNAVIDQVSRPASGTNVTWDTVTPLPVMTEFEIRLILHVDTNGQARLLQKALMITTHASPESGLAAAVLLAKESLVATYLVNEDSEVTRITSTSFTPNDPLVMTGEFGDTNALSCLLSVDANDNVNPFKHAYHPDHDNLDESFSAILAPGQESFTFSRALTLIFGSDDPEGQANPIWNVDEAGGEYREVITGIHKSPIYVKGTFRLRRAVKLGVLIE